MTDENTHGPGLSRRTLLRAAGAAGATPLLAQAASAETGLDADVSTVDKPTRIREYPTVDANGSETGTRSWRVVRGTGNCCENYLATAPDGALYDMGGNYLYESPDDGQTWRKIAPSTPYPATSEGCVSAAPGGDVCAIDWNPYSGDRVIAYKYDATDGAWYYNEVPLDTPFYDRPWFAVLEGPFTVAGDEYPYVTLMKGGYPEEDAALYISLDGLNYTLAENTAVDSTVNGSIESYLDDVPADADLDWTQPHTLGGFTPLSGGRALTDETAASAQVLGLSAGCDQTLLRNDPDGNIDTYCFDTPAGLPEGRLLADSRGHLHALHFETATTFAYRYSTDGGENWRLFRHELPDDYEVEDEFLWDFKAHGGLATTALAVHATDPNAEADQDMIFRFTGVEPGADPDLDILYVGKSELSYVVGVSTAERFDFATLGIFPDGRVALSFADYESPNPRVAIEAPGLEGEGPPLELSGTRSDDGDVFVGGETNTVVLDVTPSRDAVVRDVVPEEWTVTDAGDVDRVVHHERAGVKYVYFDGTAPADETTQFWYHAEAPDDLTDTSDYAFGPVQARIVDGEAWVTAPGTEDTNTVLA